MYIYTHICVYIFMCMYMCVLASHSDQEHAGRALPVTEVSGAEGSAVAAVSLGPWLAI